MRLTKWKLGIVLAFTIVGTQGAYAEEAIDALQPLVKPRPADSS
jgi:hypothetical protein